jgi:hypothetical protein
LFEFAPISLPKLMVLKSEMEQHVFLTISLIIEGDTEKELQFTLPLKLIYNKNFCFVEQRCIFEHSGKVNIRKKYLT